MNEDRNDEKREGRERWCLVFHHSELKKGLDFYDLGICFSERTLNCKQDLKKCEGGMM